VPGLADAAHDPVAAQLEHPAVVRVGDDHEMVGQRVGVVGRVEVPGRGAGDAGVAVTPDQLSARVGDLDDLVVLLLVRDDPSSAGREERVVVEVQVHLTGPVGEGPQDPVDGIHDQHAVVPAIGDQEVSRKRPPEYRGRPVRRGRFLPRRRPERARM